MARPNAQPTPTIVIENGDLSAKVVIPEGCDPHKVTINQLIELARDRGVVVDKAEEEALNEAVVQYRSDCQPLDRQFAVAIEPVHGEDARIEWVHGFDPADQASRSAEVDTTSGRVDFYSMQSFVSISSGDHIGTVIPETPGRDGRDVKGVSIPARHGRELPQQIDKSILRMPSGQLIAQRDGMLELGPDSLRVEPVLVVSGGVDFSTGNIDFDGDVVIRRDIRDRFTVQSTRNVTVEGLIDACTIHAGNDLVARSGIAGRGEGRIRIAGDTHARYLDQVLGSIEGSLHFTTEVLRCGLWVGGDLVGPGGAVIGGRIAVGGDVEIAVLGSGADTPTELIITDTPPPDSASGKLQREQSQAQAKAAKLRRELEMLRSSGGTTGHLAADRMTELSFEIHELDNPAETPLEPGIAAPRTRRPPEEATVRVSRTIHARVSIRIASEVAYFARPVPGPIEIWLEGRTLTYRHGDAAAHPLLSLPGVGRRTAA